MESRPLETDGFDVSRVVDRTRKIGRQLLTQQVERQSTLLGKQVAATAQALRDVGSDLQKRGQGQYVADIANALAKYVDRIGAYLQESDGPQLGHDFETLARRQPAVVGALAMVGGFIGSRVLRVSVTHRPGLERRSDVASKSGSSS